MRIRGNSSRNYEIKPLRVSMPNDNRWDGVSDFLIGPRGAPWQYLAHKMQRAIGLVAADVSPIEVRRQGVEYAVNTSSTADYGKLARVEDINGDYVDNHWPDAEDGQIYRKVSVTSWAYSGTAPSTPEGEWSGWSKENHKSANDWSDVMSFVDTWQDLCAPHFSGETSGDAAVRDLGRHRFHRFRNGDARHDHRPRLPRPLAGNHDDHAEQRTQSLHR